MEVPMQRRILVVLNSAGAFLIGGAMLAGCGAGAGPQGFTPAASSSATTTSPATSSYYTPTYTPTSTSSAAGSYSAPVTTEVAVPAPAVAKAPATKAPAPKAAAKTTAVAHAPASCGGDYYVNSSGNCIHRPVDAATAPAGATAKCNDGSYSFSAHRSGTCSGHQGVAAWL
jgi:hypothetical protein